MKAGYLTGSKGFTLLEVLLTVSVLVFGLSQISLIFAESGTAVRHIGNRLTAALMMENEVWEVREIVDDETFTGDRFYGRVREGIPEFNMAVQLRKLDGFDRLFKLEMKTTWAEGRKNVALARVRYVKGG
jgi:prepilin-type N-terminal cleavage/methylation domain-containing protein